MSFKILYSRVVFTQNTDDFQKGPRNRKHIIFSLLVLVQQW